MMVQVREASRALAAAAAATVISLGACSSHTKSRPAELGDCTPQPDASCVNPHPGAGGFSAGGASDASAGLDADSSLAPASDAAACGAALLTGPSPNCQPCIVTSCCGSGTACAADPQCPGLVACVLNCTPGGGGGACTSMCQSLFPSAATLFDDLSSCLQASCLQCPVLPKATLADF